jgi:hypothetical protein
MQAVMLYLVSAANLTTDFLRPEFLQTIQVWGLAVRVHNNATGKIVCKPAKQYKEMALSTVRPKAMPGYIFSLLPPVL